MQMLADERRRESVYSQSAALAMAIV